MNLKPDKTTFSDAEHEALRAEVRALIGPGLKQAEIGRQAEVSGSTLSQYLSGSYRGDNDAVAAALHKWQTARAKSEEVRKRIPVAPLFQALSASAEIMLRLAYAREAGRIVSICGAPGVSKTSTAIQFKHENPRTWLATMDPSTRGVNTCLVEILAAMGEPDAKGTPQALARRIQTRGVVAECLIIIDDAQHLSDQAVEQLRAINDRARSQRAKIGIALLGNEQAYTRSAHDGSQASFVQFSSRVSRRMWLMRPQAADVRALAEAWAAANGEVLTRPARDYCEKIAARPGGLRNIEMTMEAALMAAWGADQALDVEHLQWAFADQTARDRAVA